MSGPSRHLGFLGQEPSDSPYSEARVAVLPCPYDGTSTWAKGADAGPSALLAATSQLEEFDLELASSPIDLGIHVMPEVSVAGKSPAEVVAAIQAAAEPPVRDGKFLLGLGGEHTVTVGLVRAVCGSVPLGSVLQVDAHADLREQYLNEPYNHACVMRRIAEDLPDLPITSIGIRATTREEMEFARNRRFHVVPGHELGDDDWIPAAVESLRSPVYVTIDLDGLDPSVMPSTGTPMPGGLGWRPLLKLLAEVRKQHKVVAADITELKPDGINHHSEFLAAQLAYKLVGHFCSKNSDRSSGAG